MKTISIFLLLIYWSIIVFAPVINKNMKHIPKKYFPFDLNNKENILYREIIAVY